MSPIAAADKMTGQSTPIDGPMASRDDISRPSGTSIVAKKWVVRQQDYWLRS